MDADIICINKLSDIFSYNLKNKIAGVINHAYIDPYVSSLSLNNTEYYFNSGVMLINTEEWKSNKILEKFLIKINESNYKYPDQDVLNIILEDKVQFLTKQFNCFCQENIPILKDAIFVHYAGYPKPWSMMHHNNIDYLNYLLSSPWKDIPLVKPTNYKEIKKLSKVLLKKKEYIKFIYLYINYIVIKIKSDK
ncbi:glycosyltransferase family 8 protein [Proteus mirabilis]|uniref:glycosyltransferase family 8 protein n=1 Tax=Proteus mirabilis TaxID=584 RepID=UPI001E5BD833|nr:glycosyltransferase [Proteus mirabilis]MCD4610299.1 hypothetical protein [Proteus mirabilis]